MDPASCKRQKHGIENDSSPGTQSPSSIISQNRSVRLNFLAQFNDLKNGSVPEDYKAINNKRHEVINTLKQLQLVPIKLRYASPALKSSGARLHGASQNENNTNSDNVTNMDPHYVGDHVHGNMDNIRAEEATCVVDSDDKETTCAVDSDANFIQERLLTEQSGQYTDTIMLDDDYCSSEVQLVVKQGMDDMGVDSEPKEIALFDVHSTSEPPQQLINQGHDDTNIYIERHDEEKEVREGEAEDVQSKGHTDNNNISVVDPYELSCEVVRSEPTENGHYGNNDNPVDGLEDIFREMDVALACSKHIGSEHSILPSEEDICEEVVVDCPHEFLRKDDLGDVCRVCGLIQKPIENILEFQWKKRKQSYRTYPSEPRNSIDLEATTNPSGNILEVAPDALSIHPQHSEQMKPHQVEGFNFLIKNLADENDPGGCILAHAPGSGKTFMVISFVQSFLARYPAGRPLIILPKGILATWRTEFLHWQIEKIPLYDFYSSKAGTRSEQLKVLNLWEENKSILLVGYEQFSHIISDQTCKSEAVQEKLLKVPSLVILDEGHTPRNEETKLLDSLGSIRTPRKVVLSGTLFQNKVREVFNILNLVRPRFLKMGRSRAIVKHILSKVDMLGKSARSRDISDKWFADLVEANLQKDANDNVRAMIIQNLRELTANVLHYYPGELSEELPGLVDFTIFLNMSTKQEEILRGLVGLDKFSKRIKCNAVSLHPCLKDVQKDKGKNQDIVVRKIGGIISGIDINVGAKAKFLYNLLCLSEAAGEKVLVFSQYLRSLIFLEMMFREKGLKPEVHMFKITGKSTPDQRNKAVERFNNSPDAKVFFGSIKACGEGISLVGASRVVILDVHENPSVMRQALGRAFRPGQSKMVYCYRLVAADSPEEEDHNTAFRKEWVSKMWFESNEFSDNDAFELSSVDISESGDEFLESVTLRQDIRFLYKR
ncbi:hypothetical protein QYE76_070538 [Lolium multiflorum]|uniref:Uncharacterized protein n=1 Tax=Lolium multiflorum TaxID=4521 RepID=A0AAD8SJJ3_LOLMU|nr:hypothetical protein QYE76_070538 [Lolium multiflorum]